MFLIELDDDTAGNVPSDETNVHNQYKLEWPYEWATSLPGVYSSSVLVSANMLKNFSSDEVSNRARLIIIIIIILFLSVQYLTSMH